MHRLKGFIKDYKIIPLLIGLGLGIATAVGHLMIELSWFQSGVLSPHGLLRQLDLKVMDTKFRQRQLDPLPEPQVVIAGIDEKGVEKYGLWPWRRSVMADLVNTLTEAEVKAIGFDAVFSDENRDADYLRQFLREYNDSGVSEQNKVGGQLGGLGRNQLRTTAAIDALKDMIDELPERAQNKLSLVMGRLEQTRAKEMSQFSLVSQTNQTSIQAAQALVDRIETSITKGSPDEQFATAIKNSPQTVLGYFFFKNQHEIVGVNTHTLDTTTQQTSRSAIGGVYTDLFSELENVGLDQLPVPSAIALRGNLPILGNHAKRFGYFNVLPDPDGPIRRIPMLTYYNGVFFPALSLMSFATSRDAAILPMRSELDPAGRVGGVHVDDTWIPTSGTGELLVNYYQNPMGYFPTYSISDIIEGNVATDALKDKIVLVGMTAIGLFDLRPTPFEPNTPGVYVHAAAVQNMVDQKFMARPLLTSLWEALGYILIGGLLGLLLPRVPAWAGAVSVVGGLVAWYWIDLHFFFNEGVWLLFILPSVQMLSTLLGVNLYGYLTEGVEKARIRKAFQFYMSKDVVDEVLKDPAKLQLGGERAECSMLFSDIRSFTTLSESLSPQELSTLLNRYLTPMTNIVFECKGTLDKYIGDAVMAIFGAPIHRDNHAALGCTAALKMIDELAVLNARLTAEKLPNLAIGVGVHSGEVSAGNMGSEVRFDYTVIGDNVNLSARLEGLTKQYGASVLVSETTYQQAQPYHKDLVGRVLDVVRVKGKDKPVRIVELFANSQQQDLHPETLEMFQTGFDLYQARKFQNAKLKFEAIHNQIRPGDVASKIYIERCATFLANPPANDWDGVYTATSK